MMTATDQIQAGARFRCRQAGPAARLKSWAGAMPVVLGFQPNWPLRAILLRILGAAMVLSSTGLWLLPGAGADPQMVLVRIGISVAFLFLGLVLLTTQDPSQRPEACFDPVRRELRVQQKDRRGAARTVLRRSYGSLGGAVLTAGTVRLLETDGTLLIEFPVASSAARHLLREQLSGAVPILS